MAKQLEFVRSNEVCKLVKEMERKKKKISKDIKAAKKVKDDKNVEKLEKDLAELETTVKQKICRVTLCTDGECPVGSLNNWKLLDFFNVEDKDFVVPENLVSPIIGSKKNLAVFKSDTFTGTEYKHMLVSNAQGKGWTYYIEDILDNFSGLVKDMAKYALDAVPHFEWSTKLYKTPSKLSGPTYTFDLENYEGIFGEKPGITVQELIQSKLSNKKFLRVYVTEHNPNLDQKQNYKAYYNFFVTESEAKNLSALKFENIKDKKYNAPNTIKKMMLFNSIDDIQHIKSGSLKDGSPEKSALLDLNYELTAIKF